jgi:lysophospholipase L1-like esterase
VTPAATDATHVTPTGPIGPCLRRETSRDRPVATRHDGMMAGMGVRGTLVKVAVLAGVAAGVPAAFLMSPDPVEPWRPTAAVKARIAAAEDEAQTRPPAVLFIGDSYTAGGGTVSAPLTFADLTCDRLGWNCYKDAQGGTGYTANGKVNDPAFTPYAGRLKRTRATVKPDVVIISGGRNDVGARGEAAAVTQYVTSVRAAFPGARLIVLSPFWNDDSPPEVLLDVRAATRTGAVRAGATWVDTTGWLDPSLMGPDDVHPLASGHEMIARRLAIAVRAAGL